VLPDRFLSDAALHTQQDRSKILQPHWYSRACDMPRRKIPNFQGEVLGDAFLSVLLLDAGVFDQPDDNHCAGAAVQGRCTDKKICLRTLT